MFAPKDEVNAALTVERDARKRFNGLLVTFIVVVIAFLGATGFQIHQIGNIANENRVRIAAGNEYGLNAVGCLVYQISVGRSDTRDFHQAIADAVHARLMKPPVGGPTPSAIDVEKFKDACDKFFGAVAKQPSISTPPTSSLTPTTK